MMSKKRILIAGIGGVGGYFGGVLAQHFQNSESVDICFLARGEHLARIKEKGLTIIHNNNSFTAIPALATDDAQQLGIVDYILVCTKSYDLESTIQQLRPCIDRNTVILPLLNGVDSRVRIAKLLPDNLVLDGCVYIFSRLSQAGEITNSGTSQKLFFGLDDFENEQLLLLADFMKEAGVDATFSTQISKYIWRKFILISAMATATSYFDSAIGGIISDPEKRATLVSLLDEVSQVAHAKQISISQNIVEESMQNLAKISPDATSSMHSDYQNKGHKTEVRSLSEYVVTEGEKYKIATPTYRKMLEKLKQ